MNEGKGGRPSVDRATARTFLPCMALDPAEYEALAVTPDECRSVLVLGAADWQRVLDQQGFGAQHRAELDSAAAMLAALAWTARELVAQLDGIRAEVGNEPSAAFALLHLRLQSHLQQLKATS